MAVVTLACISYKLHSKMANALVAAHSEAGVQSQDVGIEMHDKDDEGDASAGKEESSMSNTRSELI